MPWTPRSIGVPLVLAGLVINPWVIGYFATDDGVIDQPALVFALLVIGAACVLGGLQALWPWVDRLAWTHPLSPVRRALVVVLCAFLVAATHWRVTTFLGRHTHITLVDTGHEQTTAEEQRWAEDFHRRSLDAALRNGWFDIDKALAQGFQYDRVNRTHYPNQEYLFDDVIMDPERPEWLIYNDSPDGKVLVGFMFFTRELNEVGPTPGGTLAQWHFHPYDTPRCAVRGLWTVSKPDANGACAEGIPVMRTPEMFHVWFMDHPLGRFTHMNLVPEYWDEGRFELGQMHPITVHFAIALFVIAVLLDIVAVVTKRSEYHRAAWINLALAAISTVAAVAVGMSAELALQPTHEAHVTLDTHRTLAFASLGGILLLAAWRYGLRGRFPQAGAALYIVLSLASVGAIGGAGYYGGEMVYGHGAGVRALNQFARSRYWDTVRQVYRQPSAGEMRASEIDERPGLVQPTGHAGH